MPPLVTAVHPRIHTFEHEHTHYLACSVCLIDYLSYTLTYTHTHTHTHTHTRTHTHTHFILPAVCASSSTTSTHTGCGGMGVGDNTSRTNFSRHRHTHRNSILLSVCTSVCMCVCVRVSAYMCALFRCHLNTRQTVGKICLEVYPCGSRLNLGGASHTHTNIRPQTPTPTRSLLSSTGGGQGSTKGKRVGCAACGNGRGVQERN